MWALPTAQAVRGTRCLAAIPNAQLKIQKP